MMHKKRICYTLFFFLICISLTKITIHTLCAEETIEQKTERKHTIYFAGALFSARETYYNVVMTEKLEKLGYRVILPQRDGFNFLNLMLSLERKLPAEDVLPAVQDIIYYLDIGKYLSGSDIVLANLDEPVDEGVVVEIAYAKVIGKKVIGIRTDIRSPYGESRSPYGGMHFFPAYQCDKLFNFFFAGKNVAQENIQLDNIVKTINEAINSFEKQNSSAENIIPPVIRKIQEGAKILFEGITDVNDEKSIEVIAARYKENKDKLLIRPKIK